jgi:hypothetical protein
MIDHIWTVPCRFSITDGASNNVSLIEVLEEFRVPFAVPAPPGFVPRLVPATVDVVSLWARQDMNQAVAGFGRMSIVAPNGDEVAQTEYEINLREVQRFRAVSRMLGFPIQNAGRYQFRVQWRLNANDAWQQVAVVPIWVQIDPSPAPNRDGGAPQLN